MEDEKVTQEMDGRLSIKLSKDLLEKIRKKSASTGVSVSFVVRKALEEWVRENKDDN